MGPFRELFVEVAQGLLEAAALEAAERKRATGDYGYLLKSLYPPQRPSRTSLLVGAINGARGSTLCQRYGWKRVTTWHNATWSSITFGARMACGHKHEFNLGDEVIELCSPEGAIRQLDKAWSRVERCYCVPREVHT